MGSWRPDQSKEARRYVWGRTRGEDDPTRRDFAHRLRAFPALARLKTEKIGSEIHLWREVQDPSGKKYWISCLRFMDDGWGYWTVRFRTDERRWRSTDLNDLPLRLAFESAVTFYKEHFTA
ncbi:MAG: hypothetical protein WC859_01305 [Elusimicrobiota bacterium]|jgi:hypothetical protein